MRFVPTKSVDQLDLQALHRVRSRLVSQRTAIVNQTRAYDGTGLWPNHRQRHGGDDR
jgi:transposase